MLSESDKEESDSEDECVVDEWKDVSLPEEDTSDNNLTPIPTVALEADRYGVSNRAAAAICTAALIDYGIVTPDDRTNVVDHHKVWRARQKVRKSLKEEAIAEEDIQAIFFDGRKDMTLVKQRIEDKWYETKQVEDHYVLVGEPGTNYLSHLTVERGTGAAIANGLYEAMKEMEITDKIVAVGADSTAVNTGRKGGAVHLLECKLRRPLH